MHAPTWVIFCARASTTSSTTISRWGARPSMTCSNRSLETARRRAPACCLRLLQPLLHTGGLGAEHGAEAMYAHGPDAAEFQDGAAHLRSEEHTSELQSPCNLVCRLLLEK